MGSVEFGAGVDYLDMLKEGMRLISRLGTDYLTNKQVLQELYETRFGIFDHTTTPSAFAPVQFNDSECYTKHYLYSAYLDTYLFRSINKYMRMSFDEFISRPRWEMDKIVDAVERFRAKESEAGQDALTQLKNQTSTKPLKR